MYKTILVPLDGSARAEKILPPVETLARTFGAKLVLLQVVEPHVAGLAPDQLASIYALGMVEERMKTAQSYLGALRQQFMTRELEVRICVEYGPVVETILQVAEREGAELIAMASHGRTGLSRVFYGSAAAGVLNRIDRPLLLIRAQHE
jgi:nucleotide-binding universal stress UspA family protein